MALNLTARCKMSLTTVGSREARNNFADLVGRIHYGHETVIVERAGKPMVAMIPIELYEQLISEREARFQTVDRIKQRLPDIAEDEVLKDVAEVVADGRRP
jgi:prevent-host-death family protein